MSQDDVERAERKLVLREEEHRREQAESARNRMLRERAEALKAERDRLRRDNAWLQEANARLVRALREIYEADGTEALTCYGGGAVKLAQVRAALNETADASPWRSIETAPRDEEVIVYAGGAIFVAVFAWCNQLVGDQWIINPDLYWCDCDPVDAGYPDGTVLCGDYTPTHWMPLPPAPEGSE